MLILGINTATTEMGIALIRDGKVLREKKSSGPTAKAEQLVPWIIELLARAHIKKEELDLIGVARGPGAFTGLRIGVVTAKTLAQLLEIPLVGVSSLAAFASQLKDKKNGQKIRVVLNACRGDFNTALFEVNNKELSTLEEDHPEKIEELKSRIERENSLILSDLKDFGADRQIKMVPDGVGVANLALAAYQKNKIDDPLAMNPVYSHGPNIRVSERIQKLLNNKLAN